MAYRWFYLLFFVILTICGDVLALKSTPPNPKTTGEPWPMPLIYATTDDTLLLASSMFKFLAVRESCDILQDAFVRYFNYIFYAGRQHSRPRNLASVSKSDGPMLLTVLQVDVIEPCQGLYPSLEMDESYDLKMFGPTAILTAPSVWGALRGLETFSQLVYEDSEDQFVVNVTRIEDKPRFSWRGVLLDTSRHYLAKEVILQNLEAMAFNKMNVFHWHIVDDQSFPYQSRSFPELSNKGAYDPYTHIYTEEDIKEIIEFARKRGIRVVPEFDSPGHSQSWGNGLTNLLTKCYKGNEPSGKYGPIDPTTNTTYDFLRVFMKELTEVFPDKYLHLGGDEVSFSCWKSNPHIQTFMQQQGFGNNYAKLEGYYMRNLLDIVASYDSNYVVWQEVVDNGVKVAMDTVVEVWKGHQQEELFRVTGAGYRSILSSCWYLSRIAFGSDWKNHYKCDPHNFNGTAEQKKLVIGGELCMWGEFIDGTNLISRTWPRGSAVAERLWSSADMNDPNRATPRLEEHRCRMIRRGLNAEPVNGPGVCKYEYHPQL